MISIIGNDEPRPVRRNLEVDAQNAQIKDQIAHLRISCFKYLTTSSGEGLLSLTAPKAFPALVMLPLQAFKAMPTICPACFLVSPSASISGFQLAQKLSICCWARGLGNVFPHEHS